MTRKSHLITTIIATCVIFIFITFLLNSLYYKEPSALSSRLTELNRIKPIITNKVTPDSSQGHITKAVPSTKPSADNTIVQCDLSSNEGSLNTDEEFIDFAQHLQQSNSPDKQLAYILFASQSDEANQLASLLAYNQQFSGNKRVLMDLIGLCSSIPTHEACTNTLLEEASELDGDNGALWLIIANFHAAKGNSSATLEAIERAITTTHFNEYHFDKLALFMQTSKGALDVSFGQRAITGLGFHAASFAWLSKITKFCVEERSYTDRHNQLCLALGETMAVKNNSLLVNAMGLSIQSQIYKQDQNNELHLKAEEEKATIMQKSVNHELYFQAQTLMLVDEQLFNFWLTSVMEQGEAIADEMLIKEAITLSKNPYYQPCPK
jgi:hypothetical protein